MSASSTSPAASSATSRRCTCCRSSPPARSASAAARCRWRRSARCCTSASSPAQYLDGAFCRLAGGCRRRELPTLRFAQYTVAINLFGFFAVGAAVGLAGRAPAVGRCAARGRLARDRRPARLQRVRHRQPAERPGDRRRRRPGPDVQPRGVDDHRRAGGAGDRPRRRRRAAAAARLRERGSRRWPRRAACASTSTTAPATAARIDIGLTATTLAFPDGRNGYLFTFQDVTDLKRLERNARLQQRLAAVGEMAAGIAHEIRNPLASMSGSIQVLRQELPLSEEQAQLMDIVLRESERLNDTIRSFLAYARPQRFAVARLDLGKVVAGHGAAAAQQRRRPRRTTSSTSRCRAEPVWYEADENQIRQIVWNLATNGLRAMPTAGGCCCRAVETASATRDEVVLGVQDQGCGIPAEELDSIFQPFRSSFEKGTGLGLAIVHRIVTDYGGVIQVSSTVGVGTTVRVRLPVRAVAAGRRQRRRACASRRTRVTPAADRASTATAPRRRPGASQAAHPRRRRRAVDARDAADRAAARRLRRAWWPRTAAQAIERAAARAVRPAAVGHPDAGRERRRRAARRQGAQPRHRRVHDDGVRVHRHRRRGDAPGRASTTSPSRSTWTSCG